MVDFSQRMATFEEPLKAMAEGVFERLVSKLEEQRPATANIINTVHRTLTATATASITELANLTGLQLNEYGTSTRAKIADIEDKIQRLYDGGGGQGGGFSSSLSAGPLAAVTI